ncbi:hypothetical protein EON63_11675, partial [archaeon]
MAKEDLAYELIQRSLSLQQQLYDTKTGLLWEEAQFVNYQLTLINLVQLTTSYLYVDKPPPPSPSSTPSLIHDYVSCHTPLLLAAIECVTQQLGLVINQVDNYFGTCDMHIYRQEIALMMEFVESLVSCGSSKTCHCVHHSSLFPFPLDLQHNMYMVCHGYDHTHTHTHAHTHNIDNSTHTPIIHTQNINSYHLFLCVFWFKCFQYKHAVVWGELVYAMETVYGPCTPAVMDRFKRCMHGLLHGGFHTTHSSHSSSHTSTYTHSTCESDDEDDGHIHTQVPNDFIVTYADMYNLISQTPNQPTSCPSPSHIPSRPSSHASFHTLDTIHPTTSHT